mmetsp:Transcript_6075/g.6877  ORF Transcript_6075/g.6877 Transcript_6075/m.6877 type:complete len:271 (+) Transcript_6075:62-874(+)
MLQDKLGHVHSIDMVRNHLLHESDNRALMSVKSLDAHLFVHLTIDRLQTFLKVCVMGPWQKVSVTSHLSTSCISTGSSGATVCIKGIQAGNSVESEFFCLIQRQSIGLRHCRAICVFDDDSAAHLGVDMAEVVDHTSIGSICHCLSNGQLCRVFLGHPVSTWVEELWLIAIQTCVTCIWACRCSTIDLVQQLTQTLNFIALVATPCLTMSTIRIVGEAHCMVPVAGVCLVEDVGLTNLDLDVRRRPGFPSELVVSSLTCKQIDFHAEIGV